MARILVAEDAAFMRMMIKNILTQNGHEVVGEAENGAEAVERYAELKTDVTTMDLTMRERAAIAARKETLAADRSAKVVMCSALGQEAKVIESIRSGAKDFVVKPFQQDRVLSAVTTELGSRRR